MPFGQDDGIVVVVIYWKKGDASVTPAPSLMNETTVETIQFDDGRVSRRRVFTGSEPIVSAVVPEFSPIVDEVLSDDD